MADRLPQRISLPLDPETALIGVFVQWNPKRKDSPGWVRDANGCDIWQGANVRGYGLVRVNNRLQLVHRVRYEREIGPIPDEMGLDHFVCDNGPGGCCNPHHCRPTTQRENLLRGDTVTAEHAARTHCPRGHRLAGENLVKGNLARGQRKCRTCANEQRVQLRRRKREASHV